MKKIRIHHSYIKQISNEIGRTPQSVRMSLDYVFNSETAKKIRNRAKELLQEEIKKIEDNEKLLKTV